MAAPVPYRTSRAVRRLLFGVGSVATVLMVLWGSAKALDRLSIEEERVVRGYAGVVAIDLRHSHGDVELVRAAGARVRVEVESRRGFLSGHDREAELRAGELRLRGSCDFLNLGTCEEDYRIAVPVGTEVSVRTSAGAARARGLRGDLELRASAGEIDVADVRGGEVSLRSKAGQVAATRVRARELELRSSAGEVDVQRSRAAIVDADSAAGAVALELVGAPLRLDASSRAGAVEVRVPDVVYDVQVDTAAGEQEVLVRHRRGARRKIRIESRAGSVTVLPLPRSGGRAR